MKILYSVGNRIGAETQLQRILENISNKHEVKVAAYIDSSTLTPHIDWTLDSLYYNVLGTKKKSLLIELFNEKTIRSLNLKNSEMFVKEVSEFDPDLVISDFEPLSAYIAKLYNKQLWYCSPLNILTGVKWEREIFDYTTKIIYLSRSLRDLPVANKYYVYSCFGDMSNAPQLNNDYEWVTPYYKNINEVFKFDDKKRYEKMKRIYECLDERKTDFFITDGSISNISDAFYSGGKIIVCPTISNPENIVNSNIVRYKKIGTDLAQVELMDRFSIEQFEKAFDKTYDENYLDVKGYPQLHERIEEYARSI